MIILRAFICTQERFYSWVHSCVAYMQHCMSNILATLSAAYDNVAGVQSYAHRRDSIVGFTVAHAMLGC